MKSIVTKITFAMLVLMCTAFIAYAESEPNVDEEIHCLAQNIYFEARGESASGREAVAFVTMNRVESKHYPNTVCGVVWQRKQFSWTHDGASDKMGGNYLENKAKEKAYVLAKNVITAYYEAHDPTGGAIMYHADHITPYWASSYKLVVHIGDHKFYK